MSGKLDQSLDQIMSEGKVVRGRKAGKPHRKVGVKAKTSIAGPTGGIQKKSKAIKAAPAPALPVLPAAKESKIIVSNLPEDVSEAQIKDYFSQTVGAVRKVLLTYGANGRSRGIATIFFGKAESATRAAQELHGVKVDGKAMKIELVLGVQYAREMPVPASLADRMSAPNNATKNGAKHAGKEKSKLAAPKSSTNSTAKVTRNKKSGRAGRPKKKTADELDAEMVDYFGDGGAPTNAVANVNSGDTGMVDEVM